MEDRFFEAKYPEKSREKEITQILSFIKQGNSAQIISVPGAGRSTLLGLLAYNKAVRQYHLQDNASSYHFVMISFSQIHHKPPLEALKLIFLEIIDSLEDRQLEGAYEKAKAIMKESISLQDELVLFQGLKKVFDLLTLEKGLTVVLLFDQFETYIPMLTSDFFSYFRALRDRAKYKCSIVFSLSKPLEYLLEPTLFGEFAEFVEGHTVYLSMHDEVSLSFRLSYVEKKLDKTLDKTLREKVIALTTGHARLTRLGAQYLLSQEQAPTNLLETLLSDTHILAVLEEIWQTLNPAEQTHFMKNLFPNVLDDEHSQYLKHVGLMTEDRIALPLFEAFVANKKTEQNLQSEIMHLTDSGSIVKGNLEISEKLTATEFRLLAFFLEQPNTILERNTIIQGVWKDNKTVLGVTDQALDQLIFRLRRKIEDDPNNPMHLLTVKGRGFKFTP